MIIISDTSPISYLVLIDAVHILPALFGRVVIPQAVFDELSSPLAPNAVRSWLSNIPEWIDIMNINASDPTLAHLDSGEADAIALAEQLHASLLLIDERSGRLTAIQRGLDIIGVVGLLERAASRGLIDLPVAINRLLHTNFRVASSLIDALLDRHHSNIP